MTHKPRLVTDDMAQLLHAALAGVGVVKLPSMVADEHIASGKLVDVVPGWTPRGGIVHAVFPTRRGLLPSVRGLHRLSGGGVWSVAARGRQCRRLIPLQVHCRLQTHELQCPPHAPASLPMSGRGQVQGAKFLKHRALVSITMTARRQRGRW